MPNYVRTGPFVNNSAPGISAAFLNAIESVFEQSSGGTEIGKYFLTYNTSASGAFGSVYILTLSRTSTPVSVSIDTADAAPTGNAGTPSTAQLTSSGFQVVSQSTATAGNAHCGGNWTVTY